jgi:hypothetical protein
MQLEPAPVEIEIEFLEQPDQTASLSDVAERSDEVGVEAKLHGGRILEDEVEDVAHTQSG